MNPTDVAVKLPAVTGPDDQEIEGKHLILGIEKFRRPKPKHYRLIWVRGQQAWPASENKTKFRRKGEAVIAGEKLAEAHGAKFSYATR